MSNKITRYGHKSDSQIIDSLRAENAALRKEVELLRTDKHNLYRSWSELRQQLAASQLDAKRLREASSTKHIIEAHDFGQFSDDFNQPQARSVRKAIRELCEALSSPTSTDALDAYVDEKVKDATKPLVRAIDEHMVVNHQGVFNFGDDPKEALNKIAYFEQELGAYFANEQLEQITRQRDLAVSAMRSVVEWDKRRNFIVPYKVRDPLHAAIKESEV